jgi:Ion channel
MRIERRGTWRERARDPALTALLALQCFILLVAAPAASMGFWGGRLAFELSLVVFAVLVFLIADGPVATAISVLAIAFGVVATIWRQIWALSVTSSLLHGIGSLTSDLLVIYLVGRAVLAPGEITKHRVLGAIALYLTLGVAFASAYRLSWELAPASLANVSSGGSVSQAYSSTLYFSFTTLTSVGYGDIVPVQPFVRALANLQAIIGQLFPATLLARLVTLELDRQRR